MDITVFGLGYVGLPTATLLASRGYTVHGVDPNLRRVEEVNNATVNIHEPDFDSLLRSVISLNKLKASNEAKEADCYIIAVPTPLDLSNKPDMSYIKNTVEMMAHLVKKGDLIIIESTSPLGTTERLISWLSKLRSDLKLPKQVGSDGDVYFAYCPERVLPGKIVRELTQNDRVIGGINDQSGILAKKLYKSFVMGQCYLTDSRTAEMVKLTENAYRDVNIAFSNEVSIICEENNINVWQLIKLVNKHPRVNMLSPGPGVGGHCIAVDPWFLVDSSPQSANLIRAGREVNDYKIEFSIKKVLSRIELLENPIIAFFGITYKANTDDTRESPSLKVVQTVAQKMEIPIHVVDPYVEKLPKELQEFSHLYQSSIEDALDSASLLVLLVDHEEFTELPIQKLAQRHIIDFKGIWTSYSSA